MLNAKQVKLAETREKNYKLHDEKGLFLLVNKNGGKYWRFRYRIQGKEQLLSFGVYPEVNLSDARKRRDDARAKLREGIHPGKQVTNTSTDTFAQLAEDWFKARGQKSDSDIKRVSRILEKDLLPSLGKLAPDKITAPILLATIRNIESRGAIATAKKANNYAGTILRFGIAAGRCESDPSHAIKGALVRTETVHLSAFTEPDQLGKLLKATHAYEGSPTVMAAIKILPMLLCRPGEQRHLLWEHVNFKKQQIELPAESMKMKQPHIIPLATQAMEILENLYVYHRRGDYVFYSVRSASRPMSENTVNVTLRTVGFPIGTQTAHGFRATARTLLDEVLEFPVDWIEHQLAHAVKDVNGRAYNRTKHLVQRRGMMQTWADYLDELRKSPCTE